MAEGKIVAKLGNADESADITISVNSEQPLEVETAGTFTDFYAGKNYIIGLEKRQVVDVAGFKHRESPRSKKEILAAVKAAEKNADRKDKEAKKLASMTEAAQNAAKVAQERAQALKAEADTAGAVA